MAWWSGGRAVDTAELELLTKDLCIEADPTAGSRFRTAAAQLDGLDLDTAARPPVASEAARLLVGLALAGASDELRELLVPDPAVSENRWAVACFQTGDLTPVSIQDFDDPAEAVVMVAVCPDSAHGAAELVVSNERGLRWTALWRTEDHVSFQLPTADTAEAGEETEDGDQSEELAGALDRWRARLGEWSGLLGMALPPELQAAREADPAMPVQLQFPGFPPRRASATSTRSSLDAPSRRAAVQLQALEERLTHIESTVREISAGLQTLAEDTEDRDDASSEAVEHAIDVRFQVLSRVVQAALDRLGAQLVSEMKHLAPGDGDDAARSNVIDMRGSSA
jgi:hypothetical protein